MESTCHKGADGSLTITIHIKPEGDLLAQETALQLAFQAAGVLAMGETLRAFDTDGQPIVSDNKRYTSRWQEKKNIRRPLDQ